MKLNIHLECFAMRNDLLTEKTVSSFILSQILEGINISLRKN